MSVCWWRVGPVYCRRLCLCVGEGALFTSRRLCLCVGGEGALFISRRLCLCVGGGGGAVY